MIIKQSSRVGSEASDDATGRVIVCWSREREHSCLRVKTGDGATFLLPYQHFVSAHHSTAEGKETLRLLFVTHSITMQGRNFSELLSALQDYAVEWIAPAPTRYHSLNAEKSVLISHLDIQAVE